MMFRLDPLYFRKSAKRLKFLRSARSGGVSYLFSNLVIESHEDMLKTHNCGELRLSHAGEKVTLAGWLHKRRDHGGLIFIDLRDRSGLVQVRVDPGAGAAYHAADDARAEYVLQNTGTVH